VRCGTKKMVMCEATKGAPHEGGAHNSKKFKLQCFIKLGGHKSPRGREGLSE
jgi:hypothetical protein